MLDYGTTDNHTNGSRFTDSGGSLDHLDAPTIYFVAWFFRLRNTTANHRYIWAKGEAANPNLGGWGARVFNRATTGTDDFTMFHSNPSPSAGANGQGPSLAGGLPDNETHSICALYDKTNNTVEHWLDGISLGGALLQAQDIGANSDQFTVGNQSALNIGAPIAIGHLMIWNLSNFGRVMGGSSAVQYNDGKTIPRPDLLSLWIPGTVNPPVEVLRDIEATNSGTVSLLADAVDTFFQGEPVVPAPREIPSRVLRRDRFPAPIYKVEAGPEVSDLEIGDLVSLAHWGIPRAEGLVTTRESNQLTGTGEGVLGYVTGITYNPGTLKHILEIEDYEMAIHNFWSTFKMSDGTEDNKSGLTERNLGAEKTFNRTQAAWIPQSDNKLARIGPGVEKLNYQGLWLEGDTTAPRSNLVLNSNWNDTSITTAWTNGSSGDSTVNAETSLQHLLFRDNILYPRVLRCDRVTTGGPILQQSSIAVLTAESPHKVQLWYKSDGTATPGWFLQRSTDNWHWNNTSGAWQSAAVVNALPIVTSYTQFFSKRIPVDTNENWTIQVRMSNPAGSNNSVWFGQVDIQNTGYNYSPIVTDASSVIQQPYDDLVYRVLGDSSRQIAPYARFTVRFSYTTFQDSDEWGPGEEFAGLWFHTWDTFPSPANDILSIRYHTNTGINPRFELLAKLNGGSNDVVAFVEEALVPGQTYQIAAILDGNRATLLVDGVWQDTLLSDTFPDTEADTAMVLQSAKGTIADLEVIPRALSTEEILAYR